MSDELRSEGSSGTGTHDSLAVFIGLSEKAIAAAERLAAHYDAEGDRRAEKVRVFQRMLAEWRQNAASDGLASLPSGSGMGMSRGFSDFIWGDEASEFGDLLYAVEDAGRRVAREREEASS